jgi:hypothetical protein
MTAPIRFARRLALASTLVLAAFVTTAPAQERAKEPTDGFFDVPARAPGEESEPWGLPAYLITSAIGGLGIFIICKSARRS